MFVIKENGNTHVWNNSLEDDFLRFLPAHFGISKEELEVYYIPNNKHHIVKNHLGNGGSLIVENKMIFMMEGDSSVGSGIEAKSLKQWPYDGESFLGNALED